jgi:hypothetical protein
MRRAHDRGGNEVTNGILVFDGMTVGILPGDLTISFEESGSANSNAILSTAYNVLPIWLRIASDQLRHAKHASEAVATQWNANDQVNRELLLAKLEPSLQVFVACGIAMDALYDQLRPFALLSEADIQTWKSNRTAREKQILEVIRRVYRLGNEVTAQFAQNITEILKYRDMAVHPSLQLKRTCVRPDIPVGVDWKFGAYRHSNAAACFEVTMKLILYLYERKTENDECNLQMENVVKALEQLQVVRRNPSARSNE